MNYYAWILSGMALLCAVQVRAASFDPADYVLVSYELTAAQEEQFDNGDGAVSGFWSAWDRDSENRLDYVHELPETHGNGVVSAGAEDDTNYFKCNFRLPAFEDGAVDAGGCRGVWNERAVDRHGRPPGRRSGDTER
jgi:hypothetical protein